MLLLKPDMIIAATYANLSSQHSIKCSSKKIWKKGGGFHTAAIWHVTWFCKYWQVEIEMVPISHTPFEYAFFHFYLGQITPWILGRVYKLGLNAEKPRWKWHHLKEGVLLGFFGNCPFEVVGSSLILGNIFFFFLPQIIAKN